MVVSRIKILESSEIQKIAAGEVVERPVNVLKELIENSLDAKATSITIYLEDAGKKLIRIIDNGSGMSHEDAKLCFEHHATSKINTFNDLNRITTFGFRGEALSSIAAVSKVNLITKQELEQLGIELDIEQNKIEKENFINCNVGTELIIKDLFFNVPARKKFLKSKETEYRAITHLFYAFCFSYINVNFKLYSDNRLVYNCPAVQRLEKRFGQLYDHNIIQNIIELNLDNSKEYNPSYKISGAISNSKYSRYDRSQIYLFVNNRWVKNYKLVQAFIRGYQAILEPSKFPIGVVNIFIDKQEIDINIHPKKEEVQFLHPKLIENVITGSIIKSLENNFNKSLNYNAYSAKDMSAINISENIKQEVVDSQHFKEDKVISIPTYDQTIKIFTDNIRLEHNQELNSNEKNSVKNIDHKDAHDLDDYLNGGINNTDNRTKNNITEYRLIGQALKTYIIIEINDGLTLIDQHAAHERIIYQRISSNFTNVPTISLVLPEVIELISEDILMLNLNADIFIQCGIIIEQISANSIVIKQVPIFLKNILLKDIILKSIATIKENHKLEKDKLNNIIKEKIHAQISCKSAIKAGDILQPGTINQIIQDLYNVENKLTCPHGRPTIYNLTVYDIEKFFKRNYRQKIDNLFL